MSHNFDCLIDTTEMANEVSSVKHHVDATTAAVTVMQSAVIKAQQEGADRVCHKVNQGFYSMIHSQISQKMATLQSKVDAQLMRLNQQRKQLISIRDRMERDYHMIASRYAKLFNGLNRNLRQRITELDRPVLNFAVTEADKVANRSNQLVSAVPLGQTESVKLSQSVTASNLKYRAAKALESINNFISTSNRLQAITDKILLSRPMNDNTKTISVPVAILESNFDSSGNLQTQMYVSELGMGEAGRHSVETQLSAAQRTGSLSWHSRQEIDEEVANQFRQLVASSGLDQRRQKEILSMFEKHPYETLQ